jgi:hypothetical protein
MPRGRKTGDVPVGQDETFDVEWVTLGDVARLTVEKEEGTLV